MKRFLIALANEFKLARTAVPIHIVAIIQPTVMYLLMAVILVEPTFPMNVIISHNPAEEALVAAMQTVGSPIGEPYIDPHLIEERSNTNSQRQVIRIEKRAGQTTAVQYYGLIDSNIVKNYRNRLTAAALQLWQNKLGNKAVTIQEHPQLAQDVPYKLYFGMALLPMAAAAAASIIGAILTAQEFERGTILQYRLSPTSPILILGARLTRLILTGFIGAGILLIAVGISTGYWPTSLWKIGLIILPIGLISGGLGIIAGLLLQKTIPSFMVALISSFISWIIGSAFGLAAGFGGGYAIASLFTPNSYAVDLLFPLYFGNAVGNTAVSILVLALMSLGIIFVTLFVYQQQVAKQD